VCVAYLEMPVIGLAFVGAVLAFNNYFNRSKKHNDAETEQVDDGGIEDGI